MAGRRRKSDADLEYDLHGHTSEEMRLLLQTEWPGWRGMQRVRLVHGRGDVLRPALAAWCSEMGIPFEIEPNNPGSALIYPTQRNAVQPLKLTNTLKDKGLALTPVQQAELNDPVAAQKAREAEKARRQVEERKRREDATTRLQAQRRDEAMWLAEVARLDKLEKKRTGKTNLDGKPAAPVVRPPSEIKHKEGWWNAELVRVSDTDTDTLKVQKRTGLDKLAPPIIAQKPQAEPGHHATKGPSRRPERDTNADQELFEAAMRDLEGG